MPKLRIASNNIWNMDNNYPTWRDLGEDCSAEARMPGIARAFDEIAPDIVGLQEASHKVVDCLQTALIERGLRYAVHWTRFTSVIYRPELFEVIDSEYLLYPEEMDGYPGLSYNDCRSKSLNLVVFRCKQDGKIFVLGNTHLWWKPSDPNHDRYQAGSAEARSYQIALASALIEKYQKKYNAPAFFLGDMNDSYDSDPIAKAFSLGFVHAHDVAVEYASEEEGYHFCFPAGHKPYVPGPFKAAIDHILVRGLPADAVRRFDRHIPDYFEPLSDHYPVFVDVEW